MLQESKNARPIASRQIDALAHAAQAARTTLPESLHELARRCRNSGNALRQSGRNTAAEQLEAAGELLATLLQLAQPTEEALGVVLRIVATLRDPTIAFDATDWNAQLEVVRQQVDAASMVQSSVIDITQPIQRRVDLKHSQAVSQAESETALIEEAREQLQTIEICLCTLSSGHRNARTIDRLLRHVHALKGLASFAGMAEIARAAFAIEEVLQLVRVGLRQCDDECLAAIFKSHDWISEQIETLRLGPSSTEPLTKEQPNDEILDLIACCVPAVIGKPTSTQEHPTPATRPAEPTPTGNAKPEMPKTAQVFESPPKVAASPPPTTAAPPVQKTAASASEALQTVKVDRLKLSQLVNLISELNQAATQLEGEWRHLVPPEARHSPEMSRVRKLSRELQSRGLALSAVPIEGLFRKMGRVVFDLARKIGKPTQLVIEGGETEIDKTIIDQVGDPLMHLIRNSMDHGIEPATADRVAAGKPEQATITLRASQRGGSVYIEVQDDGRGLNRARIRQKAIERGLISVDRTLTDTETCRLIFHPGFSTAEKLTEISGRGVGMDVVKQNIDALNGSIDLQSKEGVGMTVSLRLPLSLALLDGLTVRVGNDRFVIPISRVREAIPLDPEQAETALRHANRLTHRGAEIPCFELGELLQVPIDATMRRVGVISEIIGESVCLLVDEVIGRQQVAVKPLKLPTESRLFAGGTVLGDGKLALVLEMDQLAVSKRDRVAS